MPELLCPKCKRFGMNHEGNGFLYCAWRDCGYMVHIDKYKEPTIRFDKFKKFRDSIKLKKG